MTSWIRAQPIPKKEEPERGFLFQTDATGFAAQFNQMFYAYLYAQKEGRALYVYDKTNAIAPNYPLLHSIFEDVSGLTFTEEMTPRATPLNRRFQQIAAHVSSLKQDQLRPAAKQLFQMKGSAQDAVQKLIDSWILPLDPLDLGIHIRSGDKVTSRRMPLLTAANYITAIRDYQKSSGKAKLNIFIATDNHILLDEIKKRADPTWKIYSAPQTTNTANGHDQNRFNGLPRRTKEAEYIQFLAEVAVLQNIPAFICTLSSHVAKFVFLTMDRLEYFKSLDETAFIPF